MLIEINLLKNSKFKLKGSDLYTELLLSPWEATLGSRIPINTIEDEIQINVPKGIQSGDRIEIPNKGYKNGQGERGNLYAEVKIVTPKELTPEEKSIFEQLNEISKFNPRLNKNK